jgi:hypothetical protein
MSRERMFFKNYLTTQTYHFPKELHDIYQKVPLKAGSDEVKRLEELVDSKIGTRFTISDSREREKTLLLLVHGNGSK